MVKYPWWQACDMVFIEKSAVEWQVSDPIQPIDKGELWSTSISHENAILPRGFRRATNTQFLQRRQFVKDADW